MSSSSLPKEAHEAATANGATRWRLPAVTLVPLASHGKVDARAAEYYEEQLTDANVAALKAADLVLVAAHSQGVLVANMLLHKLLVHGFVDPSRTNVTLISMAGIHHGPYPDLPGDLFAATKELFAFAQPHSDVAKRYMCTVKYLLDHGVKMFCVASLMVQVVPLFSAMLHLVHSNANLMRALYVPLSAQLLDVAEVQVPIALIAVALHVSNSPHLSHVMSRCDNDVLVHLSGYVRGRLLRRNGGAHSDIHREQTVFDHGVLWALQGAGRRTCVVTNTTSSASFAPLFNDTFTCSSANSHLLLVRTQQLLAAAHQLDGDSAHHIEEDHEYHNAVAAIPAAAAAAAAEQKTKSALRPVLNEQRYARASRYSTEVSMLYNAQMAPIALSQRVRRLRRTFKQWRPQSRTLRWLRHTLEPVFAERVLSKL
jgi:hypothetical protein